MSPSFFQFARAACLAALCACTTARAGRPMVVDDAAIVDPGSCQVEAWTQRTHGQREYWAMPACGVGGWELGVGWGHVGTDDAAAYRTRAIRAKTVFHPLETNGWGIGLTLADQYREGGGLAGDLTALVPLSVSLLEDRVLLHANAGWTRPQATRRGGALWAAGLEWAVAGPFTLTLESYGTRRGHGYTQAGLRLDAIPGRLALDAGAGQRLGQGGAERYLTLGMTLSTPVLR